MIKFYFLAMMFVLAARCCGGQSVLELAGSWHGNGIISADWCDQDTLHFDVMISPDDEISGRIGDAIVTGGVTGKAESGAGYSYRIVIKLKGDIIECQEISRSRIVLLVDCDGKVMTGNFYTEGYLFGRKDNGSLTGTSLLLYYK